MTRPTSRSSRNGRRTSTRIRRTNQRCSGVPHPVSCTSSIATSCRKRATASSRSRPVSSMSASRTRRRAENVRPTVGAGSEGSSISAPAARRARRGSRAGRRRDPCAPRRAGRSCSTAPRASGSAPSCRAPRSGLRSCRRPRRARSPRGAVAPRRGRASPREARARSSSRHVCAPRKSSGRQKTITPTLTRSPRSMSGTSRRTAYENGSATGALRLLDEPARRLETPAKVVDVVLVSRPRRAMAPGSARPRAPARRRVTREASRSSASAIDDA